MAIQPMISGQRGSEATLTEQILSHAICIVLPARSPPCHSTSSALTFEAHAKLELKLCKKINAV